MKTELELFSKQCLEQGGEWFLLEKSEVCSLYKTYGKFCDGRNYFNEPEVYQVFNADGKRVLSTESYFTAYGCYKTLTEENR